MTDGFYGQCIRQIAHAAHRVAHERGLPWELSQLRQHGLVGARIARAHYSSSSLGSPIPQFAWRYIYQEADRAGERILARRGAEDLPPSEERIEDALGTFAEYEWKHLISSFEYRDLDPLRSYLGDGDRLEELGRIFTGRIIRTVFNTVSERYLILALEKSRGFVCVSDPMWAAHMREKARKHNLRGDPSPFKNLSWAEFGRNRNIARNVRASDKTVEKWFKRMDRVPIEEFDGEKYEYFLWVADPLAYDRRRRGKHSN